MGITYSEENWLKTSHSGAGFLQSNSTCKKLGLTTYPARHMGFVLRTKAQDLPKPLVGLQQAAFSFF